MMGGGADGWTGILVVISNPYEILVMGLSQCVGLE